MFACMYIGISIIKVTWFRDSFICAMEVPKPRKTVFIFRWHPGYWCCQNDMLVFSSKFFVIWFMLTSTTKEIGGVNGVYSLRYGQCLFFCLSPRSIYTRARAKSKLISDDFTKVAFFLIGSHRQNRTWSPKKPNVWICHFATCERQYHGY